MCYSAGLPTEIEAMVLDYLPSWQLLYYCMEFDPCITPNCLSARIMFKDNTVSVLDRSDGYVYSCRIGVFSNIFTISSVCPFTGTKKELLMCEESVRRNDCNGRILARRMKSSRKRRRDERYFGDYVTDLQHM